VITLTNIFVAFFVIKRRDRSNEGRDRIDKFVGGAEQQDQYQNPGQRIIRVC
jgi:hypothetical protein